MLLISKIYKFYKSYTLHSCIKKAGAKYIPITQRYYFVNISRAYLISTGFEVPLYNKMFTFLVCLPPTSTPSLPNKKHSENADISSSVTFDLDV